MKELIKDFEENKVEIVAEQQQKKQIKLLGKQRKIRGLKLWEYNSSKNELKEAKFRRTNVVISCLNYSYDRTETHKVIVNENCVYFQALNRKNAERKLGIK